MREVKKFAIVNFGSVKKGGVFRKSNCWWRKEERIGGKSNLILAETQNIKRNRFFNNYFDSMDLVATEIRFIYPPNHNKIFEVL